MLILDTVEPPTHIKSKLRNLVVESRPGNNICASVLSSSISYLSDIKTSLSNLSQAQPVEIRCSILDGRSYHSGSCASADPFLKRSELVVGWQFVKITPLLSKH